MQACQGSQIDHGVTVEEKKKSRTETDGFASYRTPLHSDFMIAHSTVAGYYSWRNTVQGSWFIQVHFLSFYFLRVLPYHNHISVNIKIEKDIFCIQWSFQENKLT